MLSLRPTARAIDAAAKLRDAAREAENVLGGVSNTPDSLLPAYRAWATGQARMLEPLLPEDEIPRVLATPRYWLLHGPVDNGAAFAEYIRHELRDRITFFNEQALALEAEHYRWHPKIHEEVDPRLEITAVVLDTNVMLTHHSQLSSTPWHQLLGLKMIETVGLAIPIQVIRELDRFKMSSNNAVNRGTNRELRKDARDAIKLIEGIQDPQTTLQLTPPQVTSADADVRLLLVADKVPGVPLADPDSEIVDRTLSLRPFARDVYLVSYDVAIVFRARLAGIKAHKLTYGWDRDEQHPEA